MDMKKIKQQADSKEQKNKAETTKPHPMLAVALDTGLIDTLNLSCRSTKALKIAGITTVDKLMHTEPKTLYDIKNLGKKSVEEIVLCQERLAHGDILEQAPRSKRKRENRSALSALCGGGNAEAQDKENDGLTPGDRLQRLNAVYQEIPAWRLEQGLEAYLSAAFSELTAIVRKYADILTPLDRVKDISSVFEEVSTGSSDTRLFLLLLGLLSFDVQSELVSMFEKIFSNPNHCRFMETVQKRAAGETLQRIAEKMRMTRERVRQLEAKGLKLLEGRLLNTRINILQFINAEKGFEGILTESELNQYFGDIGHFDLFLYSLIVNPLWDTYRYNKHICAFCHITLQESVNELVGEIASLPVIIEQDRKDAILAAIAGKKHVPLKAVVLAFYNQYKKDGIVYHRGKLSLTQMYDYILEKHYPSGIKLFDDSIIEHFKYHVTATFGCVLFSQNNHAIYSRIASIAVLYERGAYIHQSYIQIEQELVDDIGAYIKASQRNTFSFNELFETFREKLFLRSNITNRYFMQGMLNYYLHGEFFFTRDTISKIQNNNFTDEIEDFIRGKPIVHKTEIFSAFKGVSLAVFSMRINNNDNIIYLGSGWYIHSEKLNIMPEDYGIKNVIEKLVKDGPLSTRKLLELLQDANSSFLVRNDVSSYGKLYGILQFMFKDYFVFSRPYIAQPGSDDISNRKVIREHLNPYTTITINELVSLCAEHQLKYFSVRSLIRDLSDEFIRINNTTLSRFTTELDDKVVAWLVALMMETIEKQGFLVASRVDDFSRYPDVDFPWNPFLLRGFVEKYMEGAITVIDIPVTDMYIMNTVFTDPQTNIDSYESLLRNVLQTKYGKEPLQTFSEAVDFLRDKSLIIGRPPKCLSSGNIIYTDESGALRIKDL
jgi:hypothetical protein